MLSSLQPEPTAYTAFLPLLLISLALLFWSVFQTVQLVSESKAMKEAIGNQETLMQNATKLRASLDAIAGQTKKLAEQGNPNAQLLVDELKKRGITINADAGQAKSTP